MNFRLLQQILSHASPAFLVLLLQNSSSKKLVCAFQLDKMYWFVCSTNASVFAVVKLSHLIYQQIGDDFCCNMLHVQVGQEKNIGKSGWFGVCLRIIQSLGLVKSLFRVGLGVAQSLFRVGLGLVQDVFRVCLAFICGLLMTIQIFFRVYLGLVDCLFSVIQVRYFRSFYSKFIAGISIHFQVPKDESKLLASLVSFLILQAD